LRPGFHARDGVARNPPIAMRAIFLVEPAEARPDSGSMRTSKKFPVIFTCIVLACSTLPQIAQAVVPPPDGGYPGGNTAEGHLALASLNTSAGLYNTAVGVYSLLSIANSSFCTGVGAGTLLANTANENTATGAGALLSNTTGLVNTATGAFALFSNTEGSDNTAIGDRALFLNITGGENTAVGDSALLSNETGNFNTASGSLALHGNTGGGGNTATGEAALFSNTSGDLNTANGYKALYSNTTGAGNTAVGEQALSNTTSDANTAVGDSALANSTGNNNTALGFSAGNNVTTASHVICIGTQGANVDNSCYIGNIFSQSSPSGTAVFVNSAGKLGTTVSSGRFKNDIKPMAKTSEAILALKPVTFRYKKEFDPTEIAQFGLVAEDVEKINPDLVVRDKEGKPYSVRYDQVNAMLLNEFLKEHRQIEELKKNFESKLAEQQNQIKALSSTLEKVSAQIELSRPATELADGP